MIRRHLVNKIIKLQDDVRKIADEVYPFIMGDYLCSEYDEIVSDINEYQDKNFEGWTIKELLEYIKYLKDLINPSLEQNI